jgi:hypothetical protein
MNFTQKRNEDGKGSRGERVVMSEAGREEEAGVEASGVGDISDIQGDLLRSSEEFRRGAGKGEYLQLRAHV